VGVASESDLVHQTGLGLCDEDVGFAPTPVAGR
jgi:hypothetical protein